jgi:hypothetical protein
MCGFTTDLINVEALSEADRNKLKAHLAEKRRKLEEEIADVDRALNNVRSKEMWSKKKQAA